MKTRLTSQDRSSAGHALLIVMCITAASMIALTATMNRAVGTSTMNARNNQYIGGLYAAEAATEKVFAMLKADFLAGNLTQITNHLSQYRGGIPLPSENAYWSKYQFNDGQGHLNSNYVACTMSAYQLSNNWGALPSQYAGLNGWTNSYRIVSNVKQISNTTYNITNACQMDVGLDLIPVFQFAIFYNGLLEFTWCAPMTINGRTHANGNIYTGTAWQLTFNGLVTDTGTVSSPAWDGYATSQYTVAAKYNAGYSTNANALTLPIGSTNVHEIINMPPAGEDANSSLGQQRYFNKADLVLLVSNSTVTLTLKTSPSDSLATNIIANYFPTNSSLTNYAQITNHFPFLNVTNFLGTGGASTNYFTDQRENDQVKATDIDMSILKSWLVTNATAKNKFPNAAGVYDLAKVPNIMYAADNRTYNTNSQLTAIRLKNAQIIPTNMVNIAGNNQPAGFTVATPNPLYIDGNYNCPNSLGLGSTNTILYPPYPASLASDALTILSTNWNDKYSATALGGSGKSAAASTTVNAAILTGIVPSTGSDANSFSGGVHNLPRLLEDWGSGASQTLTLNTSIVNLFASIRATHQFEPPGNYYQAPIRQFSFDQNFLQYSRQPPGTPMLGAVLRSKWAVPPPNTINYAGN
jgi:hypothetical protein